VTTEGASDDYCYRHPDRESYVLCQRCARTVCGECQIHAPVGVHCPECSPSQATNLRPATLGARRGGFALSTRQRPTATYVLLGLMVVTYLGQLVTGDFVTQALLYWPPLTLGEPWRMVTTMFVHSPSSVFHILFNGYSLFILGTLLERLIGPSRFVVLFFLSGFGGSVAVSVLSPMSAVVGASGAIFGLFGALFVIQRSFGGANVQLLIVLALNLVLGFVVPGISWQAHIGGLLTGALTAGILVKTRGAQQASQQRLQLGMVAGGLVAVALVRALM